MKKVLVLLVFFIFLVIKLVFSQGYVEGALIVKVIDNNAIPTINRTLNDTTVEVSDLTLQKLYLKHKLYRFEKVTPFVKSTSWFANVYVINLSGNSDSLLWELQNKTNFFAGVYKIPIYEEFFTPNDYPLYPLHWSQDYRQLDIVNAQKAWNITKGDTAIKIAIIEPNNGYDIYHPDLVNQISYMHGNVYDPNYVENLHGTALAGMAAGETDNGIVSASLGYKSKLMLYAGRNFDPDGWYYVFSNILDAAYRGAKVIACGFGNPNMNDPLLLNAINEAYDMNCLVVSAAGNQNSYDYAYPASFAHVLSVTSVGYAYDIGNSLSNFLNWKDCHCFEINCIHSSTHNDSVDICAPGYQLGILYNGGYAQYPGTNSTSSLSAGMVAGAAALVYAINPSFLNDEVTFLLKSTAVNIYNVQYNGQYLNQPYQGKLGSGRLDAFQAVLWASRYAGFEIKSGIDTVWSTPKLFGGVLRIKSGGKLSINSDVFFAADGKIIVEKGAKLIVNGGKLRAFKPNYFWQGIEVWGDVSLSQEHTGFQGYLEIKNGSVIESARTGILVAKRNDNGTIDYTKTGGIVKVSASTFKNNVVGIDFKRYHNYTSQGILLPNASSIITSNFTTNRLLNEQATHPDAYIKLYEIDELQIRSNKFINEVYQQYNERERGYGIYSNNATFRITQNGQCLPPPCPFSTNSFENLNYGIYGISGVGSHVFIYNAVFSNNIKAIFLNSIVDANVCNNTFTVQNMDNQSYGMYLNNCTGYTIENNVFNGIVHSDCIGLYIHNSGQEPNIVYKNSFNNLKYACIADGVNRSEREPVVGLQYLCNTFSENSYDISVTNKTGISEFQGSFTESAGNVFSHTCETSESDFYNNGLIINYFHGRGNSVTPLCYTSSNIVLRTGGDNACLTHNKEEEPIIFQLSIIKQQIEQTETALNSLVDGGNTEQLGFEVLTSMPNEAYDIRNELLSKSPYLSDTVMVSAINIENVLPSVMLKEVLVANPHSATSDRVITSLSERFNPLPDYMLSEIEEGKNILSSKKRIESLLSKKIVERQLLLNDIIQSYLKDSTGISIDSITTLLNNETSLESKYKLVSYYLFQNQVSQATQVFNSIPNNFTLSERELIDYEKFDSLFNIQFSLNLQNKTYFEMDSIQTLVIRSLALDTLSKAGIWAKNIVSMIDNVQFLEHFILPTINSFRKSHTSQSNPNSTENESFKIYPNPSKKYFIIEYNHKDINFTTATIRITNTTGIVVDNVIINQSQNQILYDTRQLQSGVYYCQLLSNEYVIKSVKLMIVK